MAAYTTAAEMSRQATVQATHDTNRLTRLGVSSNSGSSGMAHALTRLRGIAGPQRVTASVGIRCLDRRS